MTLQELYQHKGEVVTQIEILNNRLQAINKRLSEELSKPAEEVKEDDKSS